MNLLLFAVALKVLAIGNSYSVCTLNQFPQVAADLGLELDLMSACIGGCSLEKHVRLMDDPTLDPHPQPWACTWKYADGRKPQLPNPLWNNLRDAITADDWDIITIQQCSYLSFRPETYLPWGGELIGRIRLLAPKAEIVVQETWSDSPGAQRTKNWGLDSPTMYAQLHATYADFVQTHGLRLIPTGSAIEAARPLCQLQKQVDDSHLNPTGKFLQALVWCETLFGVDVTAGKYIPNGMTPELARQLRQVAHEQTAAVARTEEWIQCAIDEVAERGGGRVTVPPGTYHCKSIQLRSNVELHLMKGARLVGSTNSTDYASFPDDVCAIHPERSTKVFLYGWDLENVAITGEGVIDGQGPRYFDQNTVLWQYFWAKPQCERPRMLQLVNCRGIRLEGVTFKDSPCWTMLIKKCENVVFDRIKVLADLHIVNSDGVDFDTCRHVRVRNCEFSTGDDCFALRAIRDPESDEPAICEDIEITDCKLESNCQTVRFGCPSDDEIRNVTVRNVTGKGGYCLNFDYPAHYLSPDNDGYMLIHDILIENYVGEARHAGIRIKAEPGVKLRGVRNVTFRNVNIKSPNPAVYVSNVFSKMENIVYDGVTLNGVRQPNGPVAVNATNSEPLKRRDGGSWETSAESKGKSK